MFRPTRLNRQGGRPGGQVSAAPGFSRRWLQRTVRLLDGRGTAGAQSFGQRFRRFQHEKTLRRIPVVFTAFVNHTNIAMLGRFRVRYYWIQFSDLERRRISCVVNADSEMCWPSCFASHVSIQQRKFQFEFLPSDPVRLVPMDLCCVYRTIGKADAGNTA